MMRRTVQRLTSFQQAMPALTQQVREMGKMSYVPRPGAGSQHVVTVIPGDGIGPELIDATERVVEALQAPITWERFDNVSGTDKRGNPVHDLPNEVLDSIRRNRVCLKGTLFTPLSRSTSTQSLNVQLRRSLDLYINLVAGFNLPNVSTRQKDLDIVVIRENTEGEYSGLEHEVVPGVVESLKIITWKKSTRVAEYAFEYATLNNRKKLSAIHKANVVKMSDGLFLKACREVAAKYPDITYEEMIVDNTCMQLASRANQFDVMLCPNFYGNLVSNIVAGLCGSAGTVPGANIGKDAAVFEQGARHVARNLAGQGLANPTAMLFSTAMMLRHLGLDHLSDRLENAVTDVYKAGDLSKLTPDVGGAGTTASFTDAVIANVEK